MSATNRGCERKAYDFYATPPETVRAFLANFDGISSGDRILEPSAGNGQIVKVLREGGYDNRIDAVELRPEERGTLEALADNVTIGSFFDYEPDCGYDVIIGNPPYSLALDFINKSLELLHPGGLLIFLLRTNFLESEKRFKWWQEQEDQRSLHLAQAPQLHRPRHRRHQLLLVCVGAGGDRLHRSSDHQNHLRRTSAWKTLT